MDKRDVLFYIWLASSFPFGSVMPSKILKHYDGDILKFYENLETEMTNFKITEKNIEKLRKKDLAYCEEILKSCEKLNIKIVCFYDELFPERLKEIRSAPIVLYCVGNLKTTFSPCVGVVGTRNCTTTGFETAKLIVDKLVEHNITTISGCARGIDSAVHLETLKKRGNTISVLGTPLESSYPFENKELKKRIVENNGLILSEYPPKTKTSTWHFPIRNRIISALSDCVVVVQLKEKSGTILTAKKALEFKKNVFFVSPFKIFDDSCKIIKQYLRNGAKILFEIQDVLDVFENMPYKPFIAKEVPCEKNDNLNKLPENFKNLIKIVGEEKSLDEILQQTNFKAQKTLFMLTKLELLNILQKTKTGYRRCWILICFIKKF